MEQFVAHLIALLITIYSGQHTPTTEVVQHHPAVTVPEYAPDAIRHHPAVTIPEYAPTTEDWSEEGFVDPEPTGGTDGGVAPELVDDSGHVGAGEDS